MAEERDVAPDEIALISAQILFAPVVEAFAFATEGCVVTKTLHFEGQIVEETEWPHPNVSVDDCGGLVNFEVALQRDRSSDPQDRVVGGSSQTDRERENAR